MIDSRPNIISDIMAKALFSDGSTAKSRSSEFIFKGDKFACSLDITNIKLEEAKLLQLSLIEQIKSSLPSLEVSIVLTNEKAADKNQSQKKILLEGVKHLSIIASGKGGVGKSTFTALLAYKLKNMGKKVGIIDADIYGPSMPDIFGLYQKPEVVDNRMIPLEKEGILINSIGFIADPKSAISWRGPMVSKAIYQLLSLTNWGDLDYLLIDSPPGTGDIHLSLLQNYQINDAYIVTTPSKISQSDVEKAINLYQKFDLKIAAIIENMSYLEINGQKEQIFPGNAGAELSKKHNIPSLIQLPIISQLAQDCDQAKSLSKYDNLLQNLTL